MTHAHFKTIIFLDEESAVGLVLRDKNYGGMFFEVPLDGRRSLLIIGPLTDDYSIVLGSVVSKETVDRLRREGAVIPRVTSITPPELYLRLVAAANTTVKGGEQ
jgi:hypothetical protein